MALLLPLIERINKVNNYEFMSLKPCHFKHLGEFNG